MLASSFVQVNVDEDDREGRFILTGSQNLLLMHSVSQSLVGRSAIFHLLPLALNVMDTDAFERFVRLVAANTARELNLSSLAADAGIGQPAAKQWLAALRTSWLVTWIQPHFANFRKRLRKRPKLHFLDSGLVCYLLDISSPEILDRWNSVRKLSDDVSC